jgi:hypothetical protein
VEVARAEAGYWKAMDSICTCDVGDGCGALVCGHVEMGTSCFVIGG